MSEEKSMMHGVRGYIRRKFPTIMVSKNIAISGRYNMNGALWDAGWEVRLFGYGGHLILYRAYNKRKRIDDYLDDI